MNPILVATDFSTAGENAMNYGGALAQHLHRELLLLNVYRLPVPMNDMPALFMPLEELQQTATDQLSAAKEELLNQFPTVPVRAEAIPGTVNASGIVEYATEYKPSLIIVGTHGLNGIENWLGSTTMSVIREAETPVIAVPPSYKKFNFKKIAWATDLKKVSPQVAAFIKEFVSEMGASLKVIHAGEEENFVEAAIPGFMDLDAEYENISNENVTVAMQQFIEGSDIDLLIIVPHHHNLWETIFEKQHTKSIISEIPIPVLCIPDKK